MTTRGRPTAECTCRQCKAKQLAKRQQPIKPTKKTDDIHTTNLELSPKLLAVGARLIVCVLNAHIAWQNIKTQKWLWRFGNGFGASFFAYAPKFFAPGLGDSLGAVRGANAPLRLWRRFSLCGFGLGAGRRLWRAIEKNTKTENKSWHLDLRAWLRRR